MKLFSRFARSGRCSSRSQTQQRRTRPPRQNASFRPRLELLEERTLLTASLSTSVLQAGYGQLPLAFTVNEGQAAAPVNYMAQGSGYSIALTSQQAQISLGQGNTSATLNLQLVGADGSAQPIGQNELITKTNYLLGSDSSKWLTDIANYGQVEYQNVYQGVDALYSGNQGKLETTFLVHPGANANIIQMQIQGAEGLSLDGQGNLVIHTSGGDVTEQAPIAYQNISGVRQSVSSRYVLEGNNTVGSQVGAYDPSQTLIIDPTLSYSTYLGGSYSADYSIAVDSAGNAYIGGRGTITKLNSTGTAVIYSTTIGGSGYGIASDSYGIAVDSSGDAYVTGATSSTSLATTANALQPTYPGTPCGFFSVLNPTGSGLIYSTYLPGVLPKFVTGATETSYAGNIAVDSSGNAYITASANSALPTTAGAFQPTWPGGSGSSTACLMEINPYLSGTASLLYSTFLGGTGGDGGTGVALDGSGNVYVTGYTNSTNFPTTVGAFQTTYGGSGDVFVAKFNPALTGSASLIYSTYLGGSGADGVPQYFTFKNSSGSVVSPTRGPAIAVDSSGDSYVTGFTHSANFPTTAGAYQTTNIYGSSSNGVAFVSKLDPTGSKLLYSTYLGAKYKQVKGTYNQTDATGIVVDASGNATITGLTYATDFPAVNAIQSKLGGSSDTFVTTFNATGSGLLFSTYLGGSSDDWAMGIAEDSVGNVYVTGFTGSTNFPTTSGAYQTSLSSPYTGFAFMIDPPADGTTAMPSTAFSSSGVIPSSGETIPSAGNPPSQESNSQPVPLPADPRFSLVGNNPGVSAISSELSSLLSEWQSLESALLARFDSLLNLEAGAMGLSKDTLIRDLLFSGEFLPASL